MSIKCPKCQSDNPDTATFCADCGTRIILPKDIDVTKTIETPVEKLTRGTLFANRYEIIEELGRGGMGKVYRVEDTRTKEDIALKLIKPEIASEKKTIERFRNELTTARKIRHKNVCGMYDLGEYEGAYFITMEYVSGEDLKSLVSRVRLDIATVISIGKQICEGLAEAHRLGVVHRDLKPSNIMIDKEGNARIMDFGIARSVAAKGITDRGVIIGTPEYLSPEQAEAKEVDKRSDIYSLGVIMYEMVTGRVPFEGDTPLSIAMKHKSEVPKDPQKYNTQIPDDLRLLILKCLGKDMEKRYQSAGEVQSELMNIEIGIPTTVRAIPKKRPSTSREITFTFRRPWILFTALIVAVIVIGAAIIYFRGEKPIPASTKKRLVVLPFKNLGQPDDEYFADSITEEIRARMTQIEKLGIIARTSAYQYKNTDKAIKMIGEELAVDYVLDGTIHWQRSPDGPSRVRVIPELISTSDSTTLWTVVYDKDITDIFEVQASIAEQVAGALDITLADDKRKAIQTKPTANMEAYNHYLRGMDYFLRSSLEEDIRISIQMFERATELDPNFAGALARLARAYARLYWIYYFRVDTSLVKKAKEAVDKAFELSPDSPVTLGALAYYYYHGHMDYEHALEYFHQAREKLRDNFDVLEGIGYVQRRLGNFDMAVVNLKKALELDPRSYYRALEIGCSYYVMRNYKESERYFDRAISMSPDAAGAPAWKMRLYLSWEGSTQKALRVLEAVPDSVRLSEEGYPILTSVLVHTIDHDYQKALDRLSLVSSDAIKVHLFYVPKALLYARIYELMGRSELEQEQYDSARLFLEAKVKEWPEDARVHSSLGLAYAGLRRKEEAIREGKKALELLPVGKDAWRGPFRMADLARIYVMVGEYEAAVDQLELLLSIPSEISIPLLRLDPVWEPLHDNVSFQKLLTRVK